MAEAKTFDPTASQKAQAEYCSRTGAPHFAPADGRCFRCRTNIYVAKEHKDPKFGDWTTGVTVEKATASLVTGCPHCNYSYCE